MLNYSSKLYSNRLDELEDRVVGDDVVNELNEEKEEDHILDGGRGRGDAAWTVALNERRVP